MVARISILFALLAGFSVACFALDLPGTTYKVFQFPHDRIPRIDGDSVDWKMVPDSYAVGLDKTVNDTHPDHRPDPSDFDARIKVGWVKGLNRLYFLYEAYDDDWEFAGPGLQQDIFELVVDGDLSGQPLLERFQETRELTERDAHFTMHGVHAQNYHIMTPPLGKDWALAFGCNTYVKELPWANYAYNFTFAPGEPGRLTLEFWITPFDYAGCEGPQRAVETPLTENRLIGISWAFLDRDRNKSAFWNLSRHHDMYGKAEYLVGFRLMPLEPPFRTFQADWSFKILDMSRRLVYFQDETQGEARSWKWDFGDGMFSQERNPVHQYARPGDYDVVLEVDGPQGKSRREKIWDVALR